MKDVCSSFAFAAALLGDELTDQFNALSFEILPRDRFLRGVEQIGHLRFDVSFFVGGSEGF